MAWWVPIVEALLARGETRVTIFDEVESDLFAEERDTGSVRFFRGSLANKDHLFNACMSIDVVFHTSISTPSTGPANYWSREKHQYRHIFDQNVTATRNVVEACRTMNVKQLIYVSTAAVVLPSDLSSNPLQGLGESLSYAKEPSLCHYIATMSQAEQHVLKSNNRNGLLTAALRPGHIYGPRDTTGWGRGGESLSAGKGKQDHIYVGNVVHGLLKLHEKLVSPDSPPAGLAYFISDGEPTAHRDFYTRLNQRCGLPPLQQLPEPILSLLAYLNELISYVARGAMSAGGAWSTLTPASLVLTRAEYWFSTQRARDDLQWLPIYSPDDALQITADHYSSASADPCRPRAAAQKEESQKEE